MAAASFPRSASHSAFSPFDFLFFVWREFLPERRHVCKVCRFMYALVVYACMHTALHCTGFVIWFVIGLSVCGVCLAD